MHSTQVVADLGGLLQTLAAAERFRTLLRAVALAGMTAELSGEDVTLFAPNDQAFERMPGWAFRTLFRRPDRLRALVEQHLVSGRYRQQDLISLARVPSRAGTDLGFARKDDRELLVNGVLVLTPEILAADGVVHELDGVLFVG